MPTAVKKLGKRSTPRSNVTEARVINQGRTQYVILPKSFRLKGASVRISRAGDKVILEPIRAPAFDLRAWLDDILARGPEDVLPDDDASD
ncbi:MAG: AbrB family transcriptional regulator [Hyphomicrobiaceae bacterium]|nr:AbrB family transcriptional regulator [Hyphomicrobiaceae bacterium]